MNSGGAAGGRSVADVEERAKSAARAVIAESISNHAGVAPRGAVLHFDRVPFRTIRKHFVFVFLFLFDFQLLTPEA